MTVEHVGPESAGGVRVERLGVDPDLTVWLVGDDEECVVIDPPADAEAVLAAVGERQLTAVLCTHAAPGERTGAPALLEARPRTRIGVHLSDVAAWTASHPGVEPNLRLTGGDIVTVGDIELSVLHTPGRTPGSCCFHAPDLGMLFSGPTDIAAIERLPDLAPTTTVLPSGGDPVRLVEVREDSTGSAHSS